MKSSINIKNYIIAVFTPIILIKISLIIMLDMYSLDIRYIAIPLLILMFISTYFLRKTLNNEELLNNFIFRTINIILISFVIYYTILEHINIIN